MHGVVVTPPLNETEIMHFVYVEEKIPLLFVKRLAPVLNRKKLSKQERKDLEKVEKSRSLTFGDWIKFEKRDVVESCIEKYVKVDPLNPWRSSGEHLQIEANCIFSPSGIEWENECYCDLFGKVRVHPELKKCFIPDVAYRCWISVEVTRISSLHVEVAEYIDVLDDQNFVSEAPWNRADPRFVTIAYSDSDDSDSDSEEGIRQISYPFEIFDVHGVLISERNVYSGQYSDVKFALAYVKRGRRTPVGSSIQFDAYYSIPLRLYVIRSYRRLDKKSFTAKAFEFGSLFALEIHANWGPNLPMGYLWSKDKDLGLIHDPDGLLLPMFLSKNSFAPVCIYATYTGPSRLCCFAIKDLSEMTRKEANVAMNSDYRELSDDGLVLGDGSLLASRYLCLNIRFDSNSREGWDKLTSGTWIKFTAWSPAGMPDFRIKTWRLANNPVLTQIRAIPICTGFAFETCGFFEPDLSAIKSNVFGFIEIPFEKLSLMTKRDNSVTTVWVREDKRNKKTRFVLHSIEAPEPATSEKSKEEKESPKSLDTVRQWYLTEKFTVPCKKVDCEGKQLLQRCFNNRAIVNCLIEASADELLTGIVKLLTVENSDG